LSTVFKRRTPEPTVGGRSTALVVPVGLTVLLVGGLEALVRLTADDRLGC
jgi:hypothetical protein